MNENEKMLILKITEATKKMTQPERSYFLGVGDGIIYAKEKEKAEWMRMEREVQHQNLQSAT